MAFVIGIADVTPQPAILALIIAALAPDRFPNVCLYREEVRTIFKPQAIIHTVAQTDLTATPEATPQHSQR